GPSGPPTPRGPPPPPTRRPPSCRSPRIASSCVTPREAPGPSRMRSWTDVRQRRRPIHGARRHSRPTTRPRRDVDDQPISTRAKELRELNRERELLRRRLGGGQRVLRETVAGRGVEVGDRSRPNGWDRREGRV